MSDILVVFREPEFSPGRIEDDSAILERTAESLARRGLGVRSATADDLVTATPRAVLAMCQSAQALAALDGHVDTVPIVNSPRAIRNCFRSETVRLLRERGLPFPRTHMVDTQDSTRPDAAPCWVKRGDVHATDPRDVAFASDRADMLRTLSAFADRGIRRAALQQHVEGVVVKFYGIVDGRFFRAYVERDQPPTSIPALYNLARAGAAALGLEVFGGDCVVTPQGDPVLIDVNDWPSFGRCRDEAAEAIAGYLQDRISEGVHMGMTPHAG